ncbi:hypothetical protein Tco_0824374 [Tanacetum coccineum]|uniref:Uncharacterized protein n=1 Tax=Tanacetum coccineum TaxID=301880 RepID=A0ABQ5AKK2_9ASTR
MFKPPRALSDSCVASGSFFDNQIKANELGSGQFPVVFHSDMRNKELILLSLVISVSVDSIIRLVHETYYLLTLIGNKSIGSSHRLDRLALWGDEVLRGYRVCDKTAVKNDIMMTMHQLDHPLSGTPRTTRTGFWLGIFTVLLLDRLWEHIPIVGFMVVSYEADINIGSVPRL